MVFSLLMKLKILWLDYVQKKKRTKSLNVLHHKFKVKENSEERKNRLRERGSAQCDEDSKSSAVRAPREKRREGREQRRGGCGVGLLQRTQWQL